MKVRACSIASRRRTAGSCSRSRRSSSARRSGKRSSPTKTLPAAQPPAKPDRGTSAVRHGGRRSSQSQLRAQKTAPEMLRHSLRVSTHALTLEEAAHVLEVPCEEVERVPVGPRIDRLGKVNDSDLSAVVEDVVRREVAVHPVESEHELDVPAHSFEYWPNLELLQPRALQCTGGAIGIAD